MKELSLIVPRAAEGGLGYDKSIIGGCSSAHSRFVLMTLAWVTTLLLEFGEREAHEFHRLVPMLPCLIIPQNNFALKYCGKEGQNGVCGKHIHICM